MPTTPELDVLLGKIRNDLPTVRNLAGGPAERSPLLKLLLDQAEALARIGQWTQDVESAWSAAEASGPPTPGEVIDMTDRSFNPSRDLAKAASAKRDS